MCRSIRRFLGNLLFLAAVLTAVFFMVRGRYREVIREQLLSMLEEEKQDAEAAARKESGEAGEMP